MSPERKAGAPASERSDIYSLAVVLLRALTGGTDVATLQFIPELAPGASEHWAPILGKALREDPKRRFDAIEMAEYVHAIAE
jgi:serine/threonine protein kinase